MIFTATSSINTHLIICGTALGVASTLEGITNFFARMAGVRNYNEVQPIVEPRGLPKDVGFHADA